MLSVNQSIFVQILMMMITIIINSTDALSAMQGISSMLTVLFSYHLTLLLLLLLLSSTFQKLSSTFSTHFPVTFYHVMLVGSSII